MSIPRRELYQKFNLIDEIREGTQDYTIAEIFTENRNKPISKGNLETLFALRWAFRGVSPEKKCTIKEVINAAQYIPGVQYIPGDVQRIVRLFYNKFNKYGLEKIEKSESSDGEIYYKWNPIDVDELKDIIHPEARNIFKTESEIETFYNSKEYKCEMCGKCKRDCKTLRMAVDHWRAHSTYNIDSPKIAVLMCEKCNNIHHNFDASKIAKKHKDNLQIVKNWVKKEKEIRSAGFPPNEDDLKTQLDVKEIITKHYKTLNPLTDDFWEGLF